MIYQKNIILPYYDPQEIKFLDISFSNQANQINVNKENNTSNKN